MEVFNLAYGPLILTHFTKFIYISFPNTPTELDYSWFPTHNPQFPGSLSLFMTSLLSIAISSTLPSFRSTPTSCQDHQVFLVSEIWWDFLFCKEVTFPKNLYDRYLVTSKLWFTYAIEIYSLETTFPVLENNGNELLLGQYNHSILLCYWLKGCHKSNSSKELKKF